MKFAIVIPDGAADRPIAALGGRTPLEASRTPSLDALAAGGRVGTLRTTPKGFEAGSDVCCMTLLGYDAGRYHTGRAPLEAAALGLSPGLRDWIFRLNLVTTGESGPEAGLMLDHSAGAISDAEARVLVRDLAAHWTRSDPELAAGFTLTSGVGYRNILIDRSERGYQGAVGRVGSGVKEAKLFTVPPHEIPRKPWRKFLPRGMNAEVLIRLMDLSREVFAEHAVNRARRSRGLRPATMAWIWGQGTRPSLPSFRERYGVRGAVTTAVDLLAGIAAYIGWERLTVLGATSYHDNDYVGQGRAVCAALDRFDLAVAHVEAPDEAAHQGDWKTKVAAIEAIDKHVVGPLAAKLRSYEKGAPGGAEEAGRAGWRILVAPDHYTLVETRKHDATPPPFLIAGTGIAPGGAPRLTEKHAAASGGACVDPGDALMERFLDTRAKV